MIMIFPTCNLLLGFLRDSNTARSVLNIINDLDNALGRDMFSLLYCDELLRLLNIREIKLNDIVLSPKQLRK